MHVYEIYNTPLRAELAVLTACETGIGKSSSSEGMLSLAHSLAYAGCLSIIMSLWQIDKKTSATINAEFCKDIASEAPKNQVLLLVWNGTTWRPQSHNTPINRVSLVDINSNWNCPTLHLYTIRDKSKIALKLHILCTSHFSAPI